MVRQMKLVDDEDDVSKQPGVAREAVSLEHACMVIVHNERPVHVGSLHGGGGSTRENTGPRMVDLLSDHYFGKPTHSRALPFSNLYTISVIVFIESKQIRDK